MLKYMLYTYTKFHEISKSISELLRELISSIFFQKRNNAVKM